MKDFSLKIFTPWCISLISLLILAGCGSDNNPISPNAASLSTVNSVNSSVPKNVYSATLNGANEIPATNSMATATGVVVLDPNSNVMKATIVTADITGTAAHIHIGASGVAGPVVFPLAESSPGSGVWTATATLTTDQLAQLTSNSFYFNVHSAAFPDGEIRGQILARLPQSGVPVSTSSTDTLTASANPTTTETATNSSTSPASGTSTNTSSGSGTGTASTTGTTSGIPLGSSTTGTGNSGTTGSGTTVNTTPTSTSGIVTNTAATNTGTNNNNSTTATQAANRPVFFVNLLSGSLVIPPNASTATATAISVYRPSDKSLTSVIVSTGITATGASLRQAPASANGPLVASLTEITAGSGIWNTRSTLSDSQVSSLNANNLYYEVLSAAYPNGEVRGQIVKTQGTSKIASATSSTNNGTTGTTGTTGSAAGTPVGVATIVTPAATETTSATPAASSTGTTGTNGSTSTTTPTTLTPTVSTITPTTATTTTGTQSGLSGTTGSTIGTGTTASTGSSGLSNATTGTSAGTTTGTATPETTMPVTTGTTGSSTNTGTNPPITASAILTQ